MVLARASGAKNSHQKIHGISPNQLVFGLNPDFPSLLTDGLPVLEGKHVVR